MIDILLIIDDSLIMRPVLKIAVVESNIDKGKVESNDGWTSKNIKWFMHYESWAESNDAQKRMDESTIESFKEESQATNPFFQTVSTSLQSFSGS